MFRPKYCACGRRIVVIRRTGYRTIKVGTPQDSAHDLCSKCFKAQKDRERWQPFISELPLLSEES